MVEKSQAQKAASVKNRRSQDSVISVLLPAYNEAEILEHSVIRLHDYLVARGFPHEIVVVSNGSTDATREIGEALMKEHSWLRFFAIPERSVGKAFALAVKEASNENLVCLDMDLSSDLVFVDYAKELLDYCDMLIGSKMMGNQKRSFVRLLGSQIYILLTQLFLGLNISDYSIGAKAFRKSAILGVLSALDRWTGYILELGLYCNVSQRRVMQIGIDCNDKRKSHFNLAYEAFYRYAHLFRCWRLLKDKSSWLYR